MILELKTPSFYIRKLSEDDNGNSKWKITKKSNNDIFYITIKQRCILHIDFNNKKVSKPSPAIRKLCNYLNSQKLIPLIFINNTNKALKNVCINAGFVKLPHSVSLYIYKKTKSS